MQFTFETPLDTNVQFENASSSFEATRDTTERDRQSLIDHLRAMLASNDIDVVPQPSVEESVPSVASSTDSEGEVRTEGQLLSCGGEDAKDAIRSWPLAGVSVQVSGSVRQVVYTPPPDPSATSTAPAQILIQLPVSPSKTASASCVGSEIVGISVTGSLMYNNEASFYRGFGSEYLIGYARDGFPIYGYYAGETDACGGYEHASGYRYTVTPNADHLVSCYMGQPAPFLPM